MRDMNESSMKVLLVHNFYRQPGGEDEVFLSEVSLLRKHGHEVLKYVDYNTEAEHTHKFRATADLVWSRRSAKNIVAVATRFRPDVVHFHNTFIRISPAAIRACSQSGFPVVQTLHNYRLCCPAATFFRDGQICEQCLGKTLPFPSIVHGCWQSSRLRTLPVALMQATHTILRTWTRYVDVIIALSEFSRQKLIEGGLPERKIVVKPNFVEDQEYPSGSMTEQSVQPYAIFLGRLSPEKGVWTLIEAWRHIEQMPLKIVGDGILRRELEQVLRQHGIGNVEMLGHIPGPEARMLLKAASFLIFPSEWYEACSRTILEALACGQPIIASAIGSIPEFVVHGETGLLFEPQNPSDLVEKVRWAIRHPTELRGLGKRARKMYEDRFTPESNYALLIGIYQRAIENARFHAH